MITRRDLLRAASASALTGCVRGRPAPEWGVQSGDVDATSGVIWSRSSRPAQMQVEWSTSPRFDRVVRVPGPLVAASTDFTGKAQLTGLPSGERIHYRAWFDDSEWLTGSFGTAPLDDRNVVLAWSGDVNGQGFGIDPTRGGMPAFTALRERAPDLFLHCGDAVYADESFPPAVQLADGSVWRNLIDPERAPFAQTLADFRNTWRYARKSPQVRACSAAIPIASIWDDHEVRNDWFPGQLKDGIRADDLAPFARRAMFEHLPTLRDPRRPMYRSFAWGPLVDVFMLDGRSYRSPSDPPGPGGLLGDAQAAWLVDALAASKAVWKVVVTGQPIADIFGSPGRSVRWALDGWGNTDRRVELARILESLMRRRVKNMVWVSADVHYAAAHRFDPSRAAGGARFDAFWEFVAGPMHAATFPANPIDDAFGPEVEWCSAGPTFSGTPANGEQFFGLLAIDGKTQDLAVSFVDARGRDAHRLVVPHV